MTTLAADKPRNIVIGDQNDHQVIASDIIYDGAAVGIVKSTGLARPLTSADIFAGFAESQADNSAGVAGAIYVRVTRKGRIVLPVTGAVATDVDKHVWATDDDTFQLHGAGGVYIGKAVRYVESGKLEVEFDVGVMIDPFYGMKHELKSANYTVDAEDAGKVLWVDTDGVVITLPAVGGISNIVIANAGAYGAVGISISPNSVDMIEGPDITAADNKDLINTKATAQRGDYARIVDGDANGWTAVEVSGTWAREA